MLPDVEDALLFTSGFSSTTPLVGCYSGVLTGRERPHHIGTGGTWSRTTCALSATTSSTQLSGEQHSNVSCVPHAIIIKSSSNVANSVDPNIFAAEDMLAIFIWVLQSHPREFGLFESSWC